MENAFFAVDLGATSGRTIIGTLRNGELELEELTRFDNNLVETGGHFYWDIYALYSEIVRGLKLCAQQQLPIRSIGIDTWGVDFVCIGEDKQILRNPLAYRDPHSIPAMDEYLAQVNTREKVYEKTGIQFLNFNSLFQLYAMHRADNSALRHADKVLFMPDALIWMLTGHEVCEYTIASTSALLNPRTGDLDDELLQSVGLHRNQFGPMVAPGTIVAPLSEELQRQTGLGPLPVVAVAGHDTGSAVAAVPAANEHFAYLSSGTWSLMGIESPQPIINTQSLACNFTNEGGIEGTTRFLKNICGMWLYERCRKEWKEADANNPNAATDLAHHTLQQAAMQVQAFRSIINPDDAAFANPESMVEAIQNYCRQTSQPLPQTRAEICRCIFDSLALRYRQVFELLKTFAPFPIHVLHIIGGGSQNPYLNQFTANALHTEVLAGPQECTAIGNIMLQAKAAGVVTDIWQMRHIIRNSVKVETYQPQDKSAWDEAYEHYCKIVNAKA